MKKIFGTRPSGWEVRAQTRKTVPEIPGRPPAENRAPVYIIDRREPELDRMIREFENEMTGYQKMPPETSCFQVTPAVTAENGFAGNAGVRACRGLKKIPGT
ncbi:MAG: hypothetical protein R2861_15060 [Desulfobacterales bacterium]